MPGGRAVPGLRNQAACLITCARARIEYRHPGLPRIGGVRDHRIEDGVVEVGRMAGVIWWSVSDELFELVPADGHIEPEDSFTIQVRRFVEAAIVLGHDRRVMTSTPGRPAANVMISSSVTAHYPATAGAIGQDPAVGVKSGRAESLRTEGAGEVPVEDL